MGRILKMQSSDHPFLGKGIVVLDEAGFNAEIIEITLVMVSRKNPLVFVDVGLDQKCPGKLCFGYLHTIFPIADARMLSHSLPYCPYRGKTG